jgi:hypothetical protein
MCNPVGNDVAIFPDSVISKCEGMYEATKKAYDEATSLPRRIVGVDVAVSEGSRADWSVFTVLDIMDGYPALVRDVVRKHLSSEGNFLEVQRLYKLWNPNKIAIEKNSVGQGVWAHCADDPVLKSVVVPFETRATNKENIISFLEVTMRTGGLAIPVNQQLRDELNSLTYVKTKRGTQTYKGVGEHDDMVMSLAIALEHTRNLGVSSLTII